MAKHRKTDPDAAHRRAVAARVKRMAGGGEAAAGARATPSRPKFERRETGLEVLRRTGKLVPPQIKAGERYGRLWREAQIEGEGAMKSSLAALEAGPGGGGGGLTPLEPVEHLLQIRRELHAAQLALGGDAGLIGACDVVCGKQWTIGQVTGVRREAEAIATLLWTALNMLANHFAAAARTGQSGPVSS